MDNNQINRDYGEPEETPESGSQGGQNNGWSYGGDGGRQGGQNNGWNYGQNSGQNSGSQNGWGYNQNYNPYYQTTNGGYGNGSYNGYNGYNGTGRPPVDENGNPMKNNYAMKLVFSILEMLSFFLCNIFSLILGILGCVFTCKANEAYKRGDAEAFKSAKTTSTVCLWIGFAFNVIQAILLAIYLVFFFKVYALIMSNPEYLDRFMEGDVNLDDLEGIDDLDDLRDYLQNLEPVIQPQFERYYQFELDYAILELPMDMDDFLELGYYVEDADSTYLGTYEYDIYEFYNSPDMSSPIGMVTVANDGVGTHTLDELQAVGVLVYNEPSVKSFEMANGVDFNTAKADVLALFGETADVEQTDDGLAIYTWYPMVDDVYNYVEVCFSGEEIIGIDICYYGY